jgi:hypothetical protein
VSGNAPIENRSWSVPEQRQAFEAALHSSALTALERRACASGVERQLRLNPRVERDLPRYGPEAIVQLCSARVIGLYMTIVGLVGLPFALIGAGMIAIPIYAVMVLLLTLCLGRAISSSRTGRRWRALNRG